MIKKFLAISALVVAFSTPAFAKDLPDFTELYEKQGPTVVNISTTQTVHGGGQGMVPFPNVPEDDPFYEFFKRFGQPGGQGSQDYKAQSLGSGFIISSDGYILTNAHVVNDADEVIVKLADKREFKARIIGIDRRSDVSLLKIDASNLPKVTLGDPGQLKVGEWVAAIGAPFGLENTVTAGIVSAKGRALPQENYVPFIQTDVAINPGNSGGPLFNLRGEVVGINSQIYSRSGGYMGLSFAIPIDVAMDVQNQLRSGGRVARGWLGIGIQEISKELADSFGMKNTNGALVAGIEKGSPAEKAGLEPGDVILKFDGKPIAASSDLPRIVGATKPGREVTVELLRRDVVRNLSVKIGEMPADDKVEVRPARGPDKAEPNRLGLLVRELTPQLKKKLGGRNGVLVVGAESAAAQAGIRRGDVILAVNNNEVQSPEQFNKLVMVVPSGKTIALLVMRGDNTLYVPVKVNGGNK
ncbi:putative periplasmic serine endoprotease DegP-like precursor [mine drainage metagenome]|uniref:Probable periplasmic serine endoprotease DegP-like n=1 Tax=mine drainage metagenome TaxID=410659 RepID=A0A1J5R4J6_9ZZZZ